MDNNERSHINTEVSNKLENEDINSKQQPAFSPDLNPIEHARDAFGRRVSQRTRFPLIVQELKIVFREKWGNIL